MRKNWIVKVTNVLTGETRETWEPWQWNYSKATAVAREELFPECKTGKWRYEVIREDE